MSETLESAGPTACEMPPAASEWPVPNPAEERSLILLKATNLVKRYAGRTVVDHVSFEIGHREVVGLLGRNGAGKTTTFRMVMGMVEPNEGQVIFDGIDLLSITDRQMRHYRWREMAMIFQSAMNALNPVRKISDQIAEAILLHGLMDHERADRRVEELLDLVGIAKARKDQYPHQYSGGMRQRAMIAMALACKPRLLFADEPTTALDVMIQAQIL